MSHQFVYTSVPSGLKPGSQGYCMVAATQGLPQNLASQFEKLSGYKHLFKPNDRKNPVGYGHVVIRVSGTFYHVVSRVADAGLDYTNRSNLIAHHVALQAQAAEQPEGGPAWLLDPQQGKFFTEWSGDPRQLPDFPAASGGDRAAVCRAWQAASGHAGWGGVVAETALSTVPGKVAIIYPAGLDMLPLLRESMALLPPSIRWRVTFNTYFTQLLPGQECHWRCIPAGTPQAKNLRGMTVIDLSAGQPPPAGIGKQAGEQGTPLFSATQTSQSGPHIGGPRPVRGVAAATGAAAGTSANVQSETPRVSAGPPLVGGAAPPARTPPRRDGAGAWSGSGGSEGGVTLKQKRSKKQSTKKKPSSHLMLTFYVLLFCILPITAAGVILAWGPIKEVVLGHDDSKDTGQQNQDEQNENQQNQDEQNENQQNQDEQNENQQNQDEQNENQQNQDEQNENQQNQDEQNENQQNQDEQNQDEQNQDEQNENQQSNDSSDAGQQDRSNNNGAGDVVEVRLTLLEKSDGVLDLNKNAAAGETPHWTVTLDEDTNAALIYKLEPPEPSISIDVKPVIESENNIVVETDGSDRLTIKPNKNFFTDNEGLTYRIEHNGEPIGQLTIVVNGEDDNLEIVTDNIPAAEVGKRWEVNLKAEDPDDRSKTDFQWDFSGSDQPQAMNLEGSKLEWTPSLNDLGPQEFTITVMRSNDTGKAEQEMEFNVQPPANLGLPERSIDDIPENPQEFATIVDLPSILTSHRLTLRLIPKSGYQIEQREDVSDEARLTLDYPRGTTAVWGITDLSPKVKIRQVAHLYKTVDQAGLQQLKIRIGDLKSDSKKRDLAETLGLLRLQVTLEEKRNAGQGEIQLKYKNEAKKLGRIDSLLKGRSTDVKKWPQVVSINNWRVEATPAEEESSKGRKVIIEKDAQEIGNIFLHEPKGEGDARQADLYIKFDGFWNLKTTLTWTRDRKPEDLYDDSIKLKMGPIDVDEVYGRGQQFGFEKGKKFNNYTEFTADAWGVIKKRKEVLDNEMAGIKNEASNLLRRENEHKRALGSIIDKKKKQEVRAAIGNIEARFKSLSHDKAENEKKKKRFSKLLGHSSINEKNSELKAALKKLKVKYSFDVATPHTGAVGGGASKGVSPPTE